MDIDLSAFQLVDAMNDIDMLRISDPEYRQQQNQQSQNRESTQHEYNQNMHNSNNSFNVQNELNSLFQSNQPNDSPMNSYIAYNKNNTTHPSQLMASPHYGTPPSSLSKREYCDQQEVFNATSKKNNNNPITPSAAYSYQQNQIAPYNDMDFVPLTSPAILPQQDSRHPKTPTFRRQMMFSADDTAHHLSDDQIKEQYEQLEQAKLAITQKLSELQKSQQNQYTQEINNTINFYPSMTSTLSVVSSPLTQASMQPPNQIINTNLYPTSTSSSPIQSPPLAPVTPASLMKLKTPRANRRIEFSTDGRRSKKVRLSSCEQSPRTLKPLLVSPTLKSVQDAERILQTRSNYQNLMEGQGAALGIAFTSQIKSGLEVRRTAHKAAEQKRRDSLKEWFDRLRHEVEEGYVKRQGLMTHEEGSEEEGKPLSKVLLLQYAYEYITSLKMVVEEKDRVIEALGGPGSLKKKEDDIDQDESLLKNKDVFKDGDVVKDDDVVEDGDVVKDDGVVKDNNVVKEDDVIKDE